jgi:sucrose-6-phosphate hydrolase SacC (GH32 family)
MLGCLLAASVAGGAETDKTLVSWVTLTSAAGRAGSILTVQLGDEFDGIVFAELAPGKWMAGSDNYHRTQKSQGDYRPEAVDGRTAVQMAIVYRGDEITVFRNGRRYASHKAKNVGLLSSKESFIVFGLRHVGGQGSVSGKIDDARIYDRALEAYELRGLEANVKSDIEPYAWWDFSGDKVVDRMGRFPHSKLARGAKLEGGSLVLRKGSAVVAARTEKGATLSRRPSQRKFTGPYVPETPEWPENPPDNWAIYHLAHPTFTMGSPFDPNPAFYYKGRYHLHYIYKNHAGFVFAHVSSKDMVRWKWHPTVLAPPVTGHGMFSGTGFFTKEGKPAMVYCGWGSNRNQISYGLDDDLDKWSKPEVMLPTDADGNPITSMPYFDPDIWIMDGIYYGMNARSSRLPPVIMKSNNLKDWKLIGELLHPDFDEKKLGVSKGEDISCPNMFKLGDKWMLVCISHRLGCRYFIGEFKDEQFLPEQHGLLGGQSNRYFAPESLLTKDGRRVNWTWYRGGQTKGVQSLPTELELPEDGILRIMPARELESLRYDEQSQRDIVVGNGSAVVLEEIKGDHLELDVLITDSGENSFGVEVLCPEAGQGGLRIRVNRANNLLEVGNEKLPFTLKKGEALSMRVFVDSTLVEVFLNDRVVVMSDKGRRAGATINDRVALFSEGGDLTVDRVTAWKMKSAYEGGSVFHKE